VLQLVLLVEAGVPSQPLYFHDQVVNHINSNSITPSSISSNRWTQRYYASSTHFQGPGSPIFLIMGGENAIEPSVGLYYPFVVHYLARDFGAYVLQPEHRFYGESQPLGSDFEFSPENMNITTTLMTTEQAMWDAVRLVRFIQTELGCELDKTRNPKEYCPVITVGGSYPGFLSAMMRVRHPDVVDMAYSASAPMKFYSQNINQTDYYDHITRVADKAYAGCSDAVRRNLVYSLGNMVREVKTIDAFQEMLSMLGICKNTVPAYIQGRGDDIEMMRTIFYQELNMVVAYTFANYNMAFYPPGNTTSLYQACSLFLNQDLEPYQRLYHFLVGVEKSKSYTNFIDQQQCFNMTSQLPFGKNATISSGDWSGVGSQRNGQMWDFQTCNLLVEQIGFGKKSMFPERPWTMEWLQEHCQLRFGVTPDPYKLVHEWEFDDLERVGATRILFTNGLNDGWSVGGIKHNISETLLVLNFDNGAHHSDLSAIGPSDRDTVDIRNGFVQITSILKGWLDSLSQRRHPTQPIQSSLTSTT